MSQHLQTQPLKTMKKAVWPTRKHRFQLSSFSRKCLEKWSQGTLVWHILATKNTKSTSKETSKKTPKNNCWKWQKSSQTGIVSFGFRTSFFQLFRTRNPLGHQSPKKWETCDQKVTNRSPKWTQKPKSNTGFQKTCCKFANEDLIFTNCLLAEPGPAECA